MTKPAVQLCRVCGDPAYTTDDTGQPAHPCCVAWQAKTGRTDPNCPHCIASKALVRGRGERQAHDLYPSGRRRRAPHR